MCNGCLVMLVGNVCCVWYWCVVGTVVGVVCYVLVFVVRLLSCGGCCLL